MHPHHNCRQLFLVRRGTQKCVRYPEQFACAQACDRAARVAARTGYARETANYGNSMLRFMSVRFQPRCLHTHPYHEMGRFSPSLMADHLPQCRLRQEQSHLRRAFRFPSMWMPTSICLSGADAGWAFRARWLQDVHLCGRQCVITWISKSSNPEIHVRVSGPSSALWPPPQGVAHSHQTCADPARSGSVFHARTV